MTTTFHESAFDHHVTLTDEDRTIEMSLTHLPETVPFFSIATFDALQNRDTHPEPQTLSQLSLAEAQTLYLFLANLDAIGLL